MLFVKESIETPQSLKYYCSPDTSTTCCACIRGTNFKSREKSKSEKFDLFFQRILEVWSNIPFLYVVIIVSSIVMPDFMILLLIMAFFGWINMTWVMRTMTYREKEREYVLAARSLGASHAQLGRTAPAGLVQHGCLVDLLFCGGRFGGDPHGGDLHRRGHPGSL